MAGIKFQNDLTSIRQFNCPNCGGDLTMVNKRANYVGCRHCGHLLDARSEEYSIIQKLANPSKYPPISFIRLGMYANFGGVRYKVIGRTRWRSNYLEYYREEGESGYSREVWEYDEWLLVSERNTYIFLIDDRDGFYYSKSIVPNHPSLPYENQVLHFNSGKAVRMQEIGESKVEYFEGESTYQVLPGEQVRFGMYERGGLKYIVEYRLHEDEERIKEIEFFTERKLSNKTIFEAFTENPEVKKFWEKAGGRRFVRNVFMGAASVLLLLWIIAISGSGKEVFRESFKIQDVLNNTPGEASAVSDYQSTRDSIQKRIRLAAWAGEDSLKRLLDANPEYDYYADLIPELKDREALAVLIGQDTLDESSSTRVRAGLNIGPLKLDKVNSVYEIALRVNSLRDNTEFWLGVEVLDSNEVIYTLQGSLFMFSGYEDGEYWTEKALESNSRFRLDKAGQYSFKVFGSSEVLDAYAGESSIDLIIRQGGMLGRYYIILFIIFSFVALGFHIASLQKPKVS